MNKYIDILIIIFLLLMISGSLIAIFILLHNQNNTVNRYLDIQREISKEMDANNTMIAFKSYIDMMKDKDNF